MHIEELMQKGSQNIWKYLAANGPVVFVSTLTLKPAPNYRKKRRGKQAAFLIVLSLIDLNMYKWFYSDFFLSYPYPTKQEK